MTDEELSSFKKVCETFHGLERAGQDDLRIVQKQIGRPAQGKILIARRCRYGHPVVVLTVPFYQPGCPIPPLLWLSCPHAASFMGRLESNGFMSECKRRLELDQRAMAESLRDDDYFATLLRKATIAGSGSECTAGDTSKGVAGGRKGAIKCLHAHIAFRFAAGRGVVGGWSLEELQRTVGTWCEKIPQACID